MFDRCLPGTLDRAQSIADTPVIDRNETILGAMNIRWKNFQLVGNTVIAKLLNLVGVVHDCRQVCGHRRSRVMGLEVCGLVSDQRISRCVRLVESVTGKLLHQIEYFICLLR